MNTCHGSSVMRRRFPAALDVRQFLDEVAGVAGDAPG
jgi:hypothetical protein